MLPAGHRPTQAPEAILESLEGFKGSKHLGAFGVDRIAQGRRPPLLFQGHQALQQGLFLAPIALEAGLIQAHHAAVLEQVAHAAGFAEVAAVLAEGQANLGGGPVAVVGEGLDQHRHPAGAVALVAHLGKGIGTAAALARALGDRPLDVGAWDPRRLGLLDRCAQLEIGGGIGPAPGGHGDLAAQAGEHRAALGIHHGLGALDLGPSAMAGHRNCWRNCWRNCGRS